MEKNKYERMQGLINKSCQYFLILNEWLRLKQCGQGLLGYFRDHGFRRVAIYGMKELGHRLLMELENSEIEVAYVIDRNPEVYNGNIRLISPEDTFDEVDAIIVTVCHEYDKVGKFICKKTNSIVVSLEDIVFGINEMERV